MAMEELTWACLPAQDDGVQVVAFFHVAVPEVQPADRALSLLTLEEHCDLSWEGRMAS
jgi:hypothetical protein